MAVLSFLSDEEVELLRRLAEQGISTREMTKHFKGRSRNAIIGFMNRNDIRNDPYSVRIPKPPKIKKEKKIKIKQRFTKEKQKPNFKYAKDPVKNKPPHPITIMQLNSRHCRAVVSPINGSDTLYCGRDALTGKSWCSLHYRAFYLPAGVRQ